MVQRAGAPQVVSVYADAIRTVRAEIEVARAVAFEGPMGDTESTALIALAHAVELLANVVAQHVEADRVR